MEYVADHGTRDDLPLAALQDAMARHYRGMTGTPSGDSPPEAAATRRSH